LDQKLRAKAVHKSGVEEITERLIPTAIEIPGRRNANVNRVGGFFNMGLVRKLTKKSYCLRSKNAVIYFKIDDISSIEIGKKTAKLTLKPTAKVTVLSGGSYDPFYSSDL